MREMKDSGIEWIGECPSAWNMYTIGSLFAVRNDKVSDTEYEPLSVTRQGILPQLENVAKSDANDNRKKVLAGDFVINSRSDRKQSCGVSPLDGSVSLICTALYPRDTEIIDAQYPNYLMKNYGFAEEFYRWGHGIVADLWTTRWQEMKSITLPLPSVYEQRRIIDALDTKCAQVDTLIANVQAQIEKLKAYKQSLITEVVTKGLDPTVPMKDSGVEWIGSIPAHWEILNFKYIATIKSNLVDPSQYLEYPQISPENIEKGSGRLLPCRTVKEVGVESNNHLFFRGQIIYSKVRPILNKVTIAPFDGLCSADMYPIETGINKKYLVYLMLSNVFLTQVKLVTENRVKMPKINQEEIARIIVCCPTSKEQEDIARLLDEKCAQIDRLIAIKQAKIEKLEQYKRSLIYEYVTGKREVV